MVGYIVSMLAGVLVFMAGVLFERMSHEDEEVVTEREETPCISPELSEQWRKLLDYDGNEREDNDENR